MREQTVEVVPAADGDCEFSYQVKKAAEGELIREIFGWNEEFQRRYHVREWTERRPEIITLGGRPVGTVAVREEAGGLEIGQFFILPEYQNRGIGGEVLERVLQEADRRGLPVGLSLLEGNRCESLYRRHGFKPVARTDKLLRMQR